MDNPTAPLDDLPRDAKRALLARLLTERAAVERRAPTSYGQRRLWFLSQLAPESPFYNLWSAVRLIGSLNEAVLEASIQEVVRRHETLRTTFAAPDGEPVQIVHTAAHVPLTLVDLQGSPGLIEEAALIADEARRPFDLRTGPLLRATLFRTADDSQILLITLHHIVADGWSLRVFFSELAALYGAFSEGGASPLPPLSIQYADYVHWQRETFRGAAHGDQLAYWTRRLAGVRMLNLPTDRPASPTQTFTGADEPFRVPRELTAALKRIAAESKASLFMVLLAAFDILLYRYTGQVDVAVGSPIANRTRHELEPLIGFFVNTLVIRTDLSGKPTFHEVLGRVRQTALDAYSNQDVPYELVVESLRPERRSGNNPLFNVMFQVLQFRRSPLSKQSLFGMPFQLVAADNRTAKFELFCTLGETADGLAGVIQYDTDLFDKDTITRMAGHYLTLLHGIAQRPDDQIDALSVLTSAERRQLLIDWNSTRTDYPSTRSVHGLFEDQAYRRPDAIAVEHGAVTVTYGDLNRRANKLAHFLARAGVGVGSMVGVCIERSVDTIVALLAILKTGGAYIPLDPTYPRDRIVFMLSDSGVRLILTESRFGNGFTGDSADHPIQVVCLDEIAAEIAAECDINPETAIGADHPAYVMYTSGSTGSPKGVVALHRGIVRLVVNTNYVSISPEDVFLFLAPLAFDASTFEIWGPLLNGARLAIFADTHPASEELSAAISRHGVTILWLTATLFHHVVATSVQALSGVQQLLAGGDVLSVAHTQTVLKELPSCRLTNGYGPTENTTFTTCHRIGADDVGPSIPIGRPVANTTVYILDARGQPCPIGIPGELYIGGDGLAKEYMNQPQLTREQFVPNPFTPDPAERLYRTGDLVRYRPDGRIEFLGRMDNQVKIHGFRVEPGEVEVRLAKHPLVSEAIVLARPTPAGDRRLIAYVKVRADGPNDSAEDNAEEAAHIAQWRELYDDTYEGSTASDPMLDTTGWNSSYTGEPISTEEMAEWRDTTVAHIKSLGARRILELGCGTGMLLFPLASGCERYVGTDFSAVAIRRLAKRVHEAGLSGKVRLIHQTADHWDAIEPATFDLVVLNSVIQYFPSAAYLLRVLHGAVDAVRDGGHVFVGDIRNLALLPAFHTSVEMWQAAPDLPTTELWRRICTRIEREQELLLDPGFFEVIPSHLPRVIRAVARPKRGCGTNEMVRFRYDAVLHVGTQAEADSSTPGKAPQPAVVMDPASELPLADEIRRRLTGERPRRLVINHVQNSRVVDAAAAAKVLAGGSFNGTVADLRSAATSVDLHAVDPEDLWTLADELAYDVDIRCSGEDPEGHMDIVLSRRGHVLPEEVQRTKATRPPGCFANKPLRGGLTVASALRHHLQRSLPEYMLPSSLMILPEFPMLPSGKVDRTKLPDPEDLPQKGSAPSRRRTAFEDAMANLWTEVLGVKSVGIDDNFFELGGHSLLATQLISRVRSMLQADVPLRALFDHPTLASFVEALQDDPRDGRRIRRIAAALAKVDRLSDAEVAALLAARRRQSAPDAP